jgi:hypothetical protein
VAEEQYQGIHEKANFPEGLQLGVSVEYSVELGAEQEVRMHDCLLCFKNPWRY